VRHQPTLFWWALTGIGVLTTALLLVYDLVVKPSAKAALQGGSKEQCEN
jgi:hypothetical protein